MQIRRLKLEALTVAPIGHIRCAGPNSLRIRLDLARISKKLKTTNLHFMPRFGPKICMTVP